MEPNEKHNEFLRRYVVPVGRDLMDQGTFEQQMVALESLVTALFGAAVRYAGRSRNDADTFLSALTHGVRGRLDKVLKAGE